MWDAKSLFVDIKPTLLFSFPLSLSSLIHLNSTLITGKIPPLLWILPFNISDHDLRFIEHPQTVNLGREEVSEVVGCRCRSSGRRKPSTTAVSLNPPELLYRSDFHENPFPIPWTDTLTSLPRPSMEFLKRRSILSGILSLPRSVPS